MSFDFEAMVYGLLKIHKEIDYKSVWIKNRLVLNSNFSHSHIIYMK